MLTLRAMLARSRVWGGSCSETSVSLAFLIPAVTVYELVRGNIKHADELNENTNVQPLFSPAQGHVNQIYLHNVPYNIILCLVVFNCMFSENTHLTYV